MSSLSTDIFSLFASDSGAYVVREDVENMLRSVDGEVPPSLRKCFTEVSVGRLTCVIYLCLTCLSVMTSQTNHHALQPYGVEEIYLYFSC